jgi:hypothetical protein
MDFLGNRGEVFSAQSARDEEKYFIAVRAVIL